MLNKKLLRKIKHEGISTLYPKPKISAEIIEDYLKNLYNKPSYLSDNNLNMIYEELVYLGNEVLHEYNLEFMEEYYTFASYFYDIYDEIDMRQRLLEQLRWLATTYLNEQKTLSSMSSDS